MEWWFQKPNQNLLKGIDPIYNTDGTITMPENQLEWARLPKPYILDFLIRIPEARASFIRIFPSLTEEEQERLVSCYQYAIKHKDSNDYLQVADDVQRVHMKRIPVRYFRG